MKPMLNITHDKWNKIEEVRKVRLSKLSNKDKIVLIDSCPCCKVGMVFASRKKNSLILECSNDTKNKYVNKLFYI